MKGLKKKLKRGLAGFLSFVLTMTSFNMVSWADVAAAFEKENATFVMSGEDLRDSAQAAIDNGDEFNFEDLGVDTSDRSLAKEYQRLFETGSVFEFAPAYDMDEEEYADGAELRMFIRINGDPEGYQITGDEDIIFLYINDSDARVTFRSRIDGYTTQKVTVKGNSTLLDAEAPTAPVGGEGNGNGGAGGAGTNGAAGGEVQNPDENAGGENGTVDGTVQNPDGNAADGSVENPDSNAADGNGTTSGEVQNPDANVDGEIDGEGAANGEVQNPDAGLDGENGNAADGVQNPDANVSDGNGTNDGTVQNPDANADGENTDHSNTNTGKEEQVQKPEDHTGTNGGAQNSDTNKTEDGGKAEAGNSESGASNGGAASDGGASNGGASDSGSSNSGASDSGSSDSGSDQGDSLVSAATLNRHYTHILTTAVNGDAGSEESDKVSSDEGKEDEKKDTANANAKDEGQSDKTDQADSVDQADKVDAADKTDKADNAETSDKHDSEDVNSNTDTKDGSNSGNADKGAVVTPDNGENQNPSEDKADDQGEVSKPDEGQGDAVIDDISDKDNADKDNADKNAAEDNKADDTTVDGKDHAANGEDGKKNDSLVVDPEADEKEEVSKTGTTSGKTYGQVVLDESYYAKAYVTTLNKLHIDVSKEGYAVTYAVTPVGTATVKGAKNVEEGKDLTFTVKPQVGYVIDHVTANGETLEAVEDDEATDSNADTGIKRFVVPEIVEEQEIVVVMAEIGEHPEFHGKVVINGVTISADAEEGILPEGTKLSVEEVTEQVEQVVKEKVEASEDTTVTSVLAYDINLMLDGKKLDNSWSENGYVNVKISGERITESSKEADKVEIVHLQTPTEEVEAAEGGVTEVPVLSELSTENIEINHVEIGSNGDDSIDVSGDSKINELSFEADHFSLYVVVNSKTYYNSYEMRLGDEPLIIKTDNAGSKYSGWSWSIENDKGVVSLSNEERGSVKVTAKVDGEAVILYYKNYMANPQKFKVTVLPGGAMVKISGPETSESVTAQLSAAVIDAENPNISQEVRWELVSGLAEVDDSGLVTKKGSQSGGASGTVVVKATSMEAPELSATYTIQFKLNNYFTFTNDSETTGVRVYYSFNGGPLKVIETGETIVVSIKASTINKRTSEGIQFYAASEEGYETTTEFSAAGGYQKGESTSLAKVPKYYGDFDFTSAISAANNKGCSLAFCYGDWTTAGTANRAFKLSADPIKVSVEYKSGAASVINMPTDSSRYTIKDTVTLKNQIPVRKGYTFSGWKLEGTDKIYNSSDKIPVKQVWKNITNKTLVFVAQWTENKDITINYVIRGNGSLTNVKETISSANQYDNPSGSTAIPYEGYKFVKWTSEDNKLAGAVSTSAKFVPDKPSSVGEYTYYAWITEDYSIKKTISVNYYRNNSFAGSEEKEVWIHADTVSLDEIKVPKVVDVSGYSYDHVVPGADGNGEIRIPSVGENDIRVYYSKKYDLEITSASRKKVYDGTVLADNSYETSGLHQGHVISGVQVEGEITSVGVADNSITGTPVIKDQKGNDVTSFYNIKYTAGKLRITEATINITASAGEKNYGEADPEVFDYSFTNGVNGESVSFDGALIRTPGEDAGSYLINLGSLALKSNGNFNANNYKIEFVQGSFTINPAVLTVRADYKTKIYGADDPNFSYNVSGEKNGEKALFTGTLNREKGEDVGKYKIVQGSLVLDSHDNFKANNYKLNYVENILEITAAPANFELSVTGGEILYDGKTHAAIVSSTNDPELVITYEHSTDNEATWQPGAIEVKDVDDGTVWIRATAVKPNYLPVEAQAFIRIIPEEIHVTAASTTKPYGSSDPEFTFDYSGAVNGEAAKFDGVLSRKEGEELGKYNITLGSLELVDNGAFKKNNYTLDFTEGILEIIKADIDLKLSIQGGLKVYDGQSHMAVAKAIEGATLRYEYSKDRIIWTNGNSSVKDVEDGILYVKATAEMSNYNSQEVETTIQVIPKRLTVTALQGNKDYGTEDPETYGFMYEGEVTGELPAFEGALTRTAGEDCNQYEISMSDLVLKDNGAFKVSNYESVYRSGIFTINPATLTVTAMDNSRQYKEKNPEFTYSVEGLRRGDLSSSLELAVIMETIATEDSVNGRYPILIKGNETAGNYKVTYVPGTLTVTDSDALTISGEGKGWTYDGVEHGLLTGPATTNVDGAEIRYTVNGSTGKEVPKALNAGTYEIEITASKANYKTVTKTVSVEVAKASLRVKADQKEREYNEANPPLSYSVDGLRGADTKESIKDELGINLETKASEITPVGVYLIEIKGKKPAQISNYEVAYQDGKLTVTDNTGMTLAATGYNG
ncbi:MBG domain-containing protein, partial [Hungatella effluvii]|uniref:MBG domain-containing protein n=1 Tax=Hungatella effluvii TaxID=1096246 RepID=UPI0022E9868D